MTDGKPLFRRELDFAAAPGKARDRPAFMQSAMPFTACRRAACEELRRGVTAYSSSSTSPALAALAAATILSAWGPGT